MLLADLIVVSLMKTELRSGRSFQGLLVWQQAMDLARGAYFLTKLLPREERYELTSQIRRASLSIPANIAEGSGRVTRGAYLNFLRIAQGSLRELETCLLFIVEVNLVTSHEVEPLLRQINSVARLLNRLMQSLTA